MPPKTVAKPAPAKPKEVEEAKKGKDEMKDMDEKDNNEKDLQNSSMAQGEEVPTDNIREYILKHYGINAEREKQRKEERVG